MLDIPLETLAWIIVKAREIDNKDANTSDSGDAGEENDDASDSQDRGDDPSEQELRSWISDLSDTEQAQLVALFWLGRGDAEADEFADLVEQAREARTGPTEDYLLGAPLLADLLEEGLEKLGIPVAEVENLI
ncbi:MAG: hypothetical protein ACJAVR_004169 [Paracoccaceae bacterium]|jgi:hypothetical protein